MDPLLLNFPPSKRISISLCFCSVGRFCQISSKESWRSDQSILYGLPNRARTGLFMSWAFLVLLSITSIHIELLIPWQLSLMLIDPLFFLYVFCIQLISPEDWLRARSLWEKFDVYAWYYLQLIWNYDCLSWDPKDGLSSRLSTYS